MENCLVTKLFATVDNDNLKKVGCIKFHAIVGSNAQINRLGGSTAPFCKIKLGGSGYFHSTRGGSDNFGNEQDSTSATFPAAGEYDIEIMNKYPLLELVMLDIEVVSIDAADFDYTSVTACALFKTAAGANFSTMPESIANSFVTWNFDDGENLATMDISIFANNNVLRYFKFSVNMGDGVFGNLYGDIVNLADKPSMTFLGIKNQKKITGDIASLGTDIGLTRIECYNSGVEGTIEGIAEAQVAAGRTSGSLVVFYGNKISYNGEYPLDSATKTITFSDSGYTVS